MWLKFNSFGFGVFKNNSITYNPYIKYDWSTTLNNGNRELVNVGTSGINGLMYSGQGISLDSTQSVTIPINSHINTVSLMRDGKLIFNEISRTVANYLLDFEAGIGYMQADSAPFTAPTSFVNILDYGAVGDGAIATDGTITGTDNHQAFSDAITANSNVYIPDGIFFSSAPIELLTSTKIIFGSGSIGVTSGNKIIVNSYQATLSDIIINGINFLIGGIAINGIESIANFYIQNCTFNGYDSLVANAISIILHQGDTSTGIKVLSNTFTNTSRFSIEFLEQWDDTYPSGIFGDIDIKNNRFIQDVDAFADANNKVISIYSIGSYCSILNNYINGYATALEFSGSGEVAYNTVENGTGSIGSGEQWSNVYIHHNILTLCMLAATGTNHNISTIFEHNKVNGILEVRYFDELTVRNNYVEFEKGDGILNIKNSSGVLCYNNHCIDKTSGDIWSIMNISDAVADSSVVFYDNTWYTPNGNVVNEQPLLAGGATPTTYNNVEITYRKKPIVNNFIFYNGIFTQTQKDYLLNNPEEFLYRENNTLNSNILTTTEINNIIEYAPCCENDNFIRGIKNYLGTEFVVGGDFTGTIGNAQAVSGGVLSNLDNTMLKIVSDGDGTYARAGWEYTVAVGGHIKIEADIISANGSCYMTEESTNSYTALTTGEHFIYTAEVGTGGKRVSFGGRNDTTFELIVDNVSVIELTSMNKISNFTQSIRDDAINLPKGLQISRLVLDIDGVPIAGAFDRVRHYGTNFIDTQWAPSGTFQIEEITEKDGTRTHRVYADDDTVFVNGVSDGAFTVLPVVQKLDGTNTEGLAIDATTLYGVHTIHKDPTTLYNDAVSNGDI